MKKKIINKTFTLPHKDVDLNLENAFLEMVKNIL